MSKPSGFRFLTVTFLAAVISALFVFMGAPFLRVLRNVYGPLKYWGAGTVICLSFWLLGLQPLTFLLGSIWLTVGCYNELEENGRSGFWSAVLCVALGSAVLIFGSIYWAHSQALNISDILKQGIESMQQQLAVRGNSSSIKLDVEAIVQQVPSAVILLLMTSLGFALMLDRRTGQMTGLRFEKIATQMKVLEFKCPDAFIWLTMSAFLFSFVKIDPPIVGVIATNVFNVMMGFYFFQGLAVLEVTLLSFKVGSFMRFLVYFILVGQLFFVLSAVGVIDYWVDFRARMKRMRQLGTDQKNGEHV